MNRLRSRIGRALACVFSLLAALSVTSFAQSGDERAVRAALVFNLTKYVEWPSEKTILVIGFLGNRETGEFLHKMLDGKTIESRAIRVMLFPSDDELQQCDLVYIAESQDRKIRAALDKLENRNIVSVGEADSFAQDGGMIGLVKTGEQIQMQVNLLAALRSGVKISPRLLKLALVVRSGASTDHVERKIVKRSDPEYPDLAKKLALHGTVKLKVQIAPDGSVHSVECLGGHPVLAESAAKAVKNWKYEVAARESTQFVDVDF